VGATSDWIDRQVTEAIGWDSPPEDLVRNRDGIFGEEYVLRIRAMGIRDHPIVARSPWQNGLCERAIGSIRRDCLDHIIVFDEGHLHHLLHCYMNFHDHSRTHLSLRKDAPLGQPVHMLGSIAARPILGGLHHNYIRI